MKKTFLNIFISFLLTYPLLIQASEIKKCKTRTFFGIGEPLSRINERNPAKTISLIKKLGTGRYREWLDFPAFFDGEEKINFTYLKKLKKIITLSEINGFGIMLMEDGNYPEWMTKIKSTDRRNSIPGRDLKPFSNYVNFLKRYRETWTTVASRLSEVEYWQIGNEVNWDYYFHPEKNSFSVEEKAEIYVDLLSNAYQAIKSVNKNFKIVTAGFAEINEHTELYLNHFFKTIQQRKKANPFFRCFDILAWHPYIEEKPTYLNFVKPNLRLYGILEKSGFGDTPVFFSELGFSEYYFSSKKKVKDIPEKIEEAISLSTQYFPWLEAIFWFRLMDDLYSKDKFEKSFGIAYSEKSKKKMQLKPAGEKYREIIREHEKGQCKNN